MQKKTMTALNPLPARATERPHQRATRIQLVGRDAYSLPARGQILRVVSGCAWVSLDGKDTIVQCGEVLKLAPTEHGAVISALGPQPLVYEVM
jgi:hypothetical protein